MSNNNKTPAIRFKGFTDTWEQRKLDTLVEFYSGLTYKPEDVTENGTLVLRSSNVKNAEVVLTDNVYVDESVVNSENVKKDDIIVVVRNGSKALIGKHAKIRHSMPNTVIGAFMTGIRSDSPDFINALLSTDTFDKEIKINMGATINQITGYMFANMEFMTPSFQERQAVGSFFSRLDDLITLHQRKCDKLIQFKAAMLQKMFPQNGADKPEIRFKGFTDAWEQRSLSSFCNYISSSLTAKDIDENGKYDLYDANTLIGKTNKGCIDEDYITIIKDGAGVGRTRLLPSKSMFLGTMGALIPDKSDLNFLYQLIINADLSKEYTGSTIPHIYFINYGKNKYFIPSIAEQRKIGTYLRNLDSVITLHQRKCDKYKSIKAGLIRKLFP